MEIIKFFEPNARVFATYEACAEAIARVLPNAEITLIGSWAVPLLGREEIDIMVRVDEVATAQEALEEVNFSTGPIVEGEGFSKNREYDGFVCEAHILPRDHPKSKYYLWAIKEFRENKNLRDAYAEMKRSMDGRPIEEYRHAKRKFLYEDTKLGWKGKEQNY